MPRSDSSSARSLAPAGSVASFFVSRIDTAVDAELEKQSPPRDLRGKAAIANAKLAYAKYLELFGGPRWQALAAKGARTQRVLWASTSTKNKAYRDVLYVEELIGPDTVNTVPPATLAAFNDHGTVESRIRHDVSGARAVLARLTALGVPAESLIGELEVEGVQAFAKSFDDLLGALETRRRELLAQRGQAR